MKLIDTIVEKENGYILKLQECSVSGFPTYIWGNGEGAENARLRSNNYPFAGNVVNKRYYSENNGCLCLEDILDNSETKINLVIAFRGYSKGVLKDYMSKLNIVVNMDCYAGNICVDPEIMTYDYVLENISKLEKIYSSLEDEKSREVLSAYINQKISMDYKYLKEAKTDNQYFENDIICFTENETFVDCGAYDGDSAVSFINNLKKNGIVDYKKIISFEPDPVNYRKLEDRKLDRHICINKGVSDKCEKLSFSVGGTSSGIDTSGSIMIETDYLDNVIDGSVTFIKMDIEGSELAAIKGASKTIVNNKPKLAICIYHRKEDMWQIQNYLHGLVPEYRFYIRAYEETATELVLYAII